ncbi:hypothetical protein [Hymenobacter cellulosilyticus]|uniref:Cortical protein marker for cell polarity n=1 Tax=Hymenobacter cellulosilyticus TaxID=2932248 RepID=A0A8T9Q4T9_9BACT|nr:hypothetical protein [Hymenobacter cellulosilyticus]UOQ70810.1 hypothetical protein MUN79_19250 [Hymenobacter cellulosilyticus]
MQHTYSLAAGRRARVVRPFVYLFLLAALLLTGPRWGWAQAPSISTVLNADGTLRDGVQGSFDAKGYELSTGAGGQPVLRPGASEWNGLGGGPVGQQNGVTGVVTAIAVSGSIVYVAGQISSAGGVAVNNIAQWNGTTWSALGTGVTNTVNALALQGTDLYVGGSFSTAGGIAVRRIAKWDGTSWSRLGTSTAYGVTGGDVSALAVIGNNVYVGGDFTQAGGVAAPSVARWDGTAWSSLGTGITSATGASGRVHAFATNGNRLYVGGFFATAGGIAANSVAQWDGAGWSSLGAGAANGVDLSVDALLMHNNTLYVGGNFTTAGAQPSPGLARWDGSAWSRVGTAEADGSGGEVWSLALNGTTLYVGGCLAR